MAGTGNVGVATQTPTFSGFPSGVTSDSYDHTFDMSLPSSYNTAAGQFYQNNGGTPTTAFNALVAGLDAGKAYLNLHTTAFPGGELRALLVPVPEPGTYALMLVGVGLVGWSARARRTA
jgi:hypothetical protein